MSMPGNAPDDLDGEKTVSDWKDLKLLAEGSMSMKVIDSNGNTKKEVKHRRIRGKGSREFVRGKGSREFVSKSGGKGNQGWLQRRFPDKK